MTALSKFLDGLFFHKIRKDNVVVVSVPQDLDFTGNVSVTSTGGRTVINIGAPPGSSGGVIYNNAGSFAGATAVFIDSGAALGFGATRATTGDIRGGTTLQIVGLDTGVARNVLLWSGNAAQVGDVNGNGVILQAKTAGQVQVLFGATLNWVFDQVGTNTPRLRCFMGSDNAAAVHPEPNFSATSTTRTVFQFLGQDKGGNTSTSGGTVRIRAGDATGAGGTHKGGMTQVWGGAATGASGTRTGGDVWLGPGFGATQKGNTVFGPSDGSFDPDTFNWQSMGGGFWFMNASAVPTGNPPSGGFMYVEAGALKWRGSGGTTTTVATA